MARLPLVVAGVVLVSGSFAWTTSVPSDAAPASGPVSGVVRINQQGYLPGEAKQARLMTTQAVRGARFRVVDARGRTRLRGRVPTRSVGRWNAHYPAVYRLGFDRLRTPRSLPDRGGRRRPRPRPRGSACCARAALRHVAPRRRALRPGPARRLGTSSPARCTAGLAPARPPRLRLHVAAHGAGRRPDPRRRPHRTGGPVDVAGGWFDAGDYLKFTHSSAYNDVLLFTSARLLGRRAPHGARRRGAPRARLAHEDVGPAPPARCYIQVGIGSGNEQGTFLGDHDRWRLPEADDHERGRRGPLRLPPAGVRRRAAGQPISPNLVGRVAAAFALAAQLDARTIRPGRWPSCTRRPCSTPAPTPPARPAARHGAAARLLPRGTWRDDMELGAAEIALAGQRLAPGSAGISATAAHWARGYLAPETGDTLNLYDTSALAHAALARPWAHRAAPRRHAGRPGATTSARQIRTRRATPPGDPFAAGGAYDEFDVNSHTFGLIATVALYDQLTAHPPLPGVRDRAAQLAARRQPLGRRRHGRGGHALPALHAAPGGQPVGQPRRRRRRWTSARSSTARTAPTTSRTGWAASRTAWCTAPPAPGRCRASTAGAAGTSTTSAPGRPTSPPWT